MTSTGFSAGFPSNSKSSSRVLKPPGGGSSDIFAGENSLTPRSVKNHMRSNIFAEPERVNKTGDKPRRVQKMDSHNRLFGELDRPVTPAKNHMKSNIPIGSTDAKLLTNKIISDERNGNNHTVVDGKTFLNGNGISSVNSLSDSGMSKYGNPVTGEGYNKKLTSSGDISTGNGGHIINKNRIPPGGFSSGLW